MLLILALAACASGNACADYVQARQACSDAAGGDTVYDADTVCGEWTAEQEEVYGDWYQCQAAAYTALECKTLSDYADAEAGAATCRAPAE